MKLWGGRFERGPSETFERFSTSLHFDRKLIFADIQGSQAFARALAKEGILTRGETQQLIAAFEEISEEAHNAKYFDGADDEDVGARRHRGDRRFARRDDRGPRVHAARMDVVRAGRHGDLHDGGARGERALRCG